MHTRIKSGNKWKHKDVQPHKLRAEENVISYAIFDKIETVLLWWAILEKPGGANSHIAKCSTYEKDLNYRMYIVEGKALNNTRSTQSVSTGATVSGTQSSLEIIVNRRNHNFN